jgi:hypothetical protein
MSRRFRLAAHAQHLGRTRPAQPIRIGAAGKIITDFDAARTNELFRRI